MKHLKHLEDLGWRIADLGMICLFFAFFVGKYSAIMQSAAGDGSHSLLWSLAEKKYIWFPYVVRVFSE